MNAILETLKPVEERKTDRLQIFIPAELAAHCADCDGVFLLTAQKCPGCGSTSYVIDRRKG